MPELPEVETITRQLRTSVVGTKIVKVKVFDTKKIKLKLACLQNKRITDVFRLGKRILVKIQTGKKDRRKGEFLYLSFHLRMTGRLIWLPEKCTADTGHLRLLIVTDKGNLCFYDVRRFGVVELGSSQAEFKRALEPLGEEFSYENFARLFSKSTQSIKQFLLRQDKIAGIGNIYASEILFYAGVSPLRKVNTLPEAGLCRIFKAIRLVLNQAVKHGGTTFSDYQDCFGKTGGHQKHLKVYLKAGQPCPNCRIGTIMRVVQQQRSTFYCPNCQA